jgi:hypothetical protein
LLKEKQNSEKLLKKHMSENRSLKKQPAMGGAAPSKMSQSVLEPSTELPKKRDLQALRNQRKE